MADYLQKSNDVTTERSQVVSYTVSPQEMVKTSEKSSDNLESLKIVGTMQALEQMTDSVYTESSLEEQESAFLSSSLVYNSDDDGFSSSDDGDDNTTVVIDENGNTVTTVTAENGDTVVTTTDPQGTTLSIVATSTDEDGNTVVSETDKYGNTVVTTTDPEGNTLSIVATTTDKNGNTIVTETDETGDTVVTTTDKNGTTVSVVTTTTDEDGYTVVSETDKYGNSVVTTTDANGNTISTSSTTVEADGTLIVTTTDETSTTVTTTTTTATSKTTTTSTTNKDGSTTTTTTTQDLSGKTISTTTTTTDKNGKSTTTTTAADGSTSTTTTDADGNKVVTTTDSSGNEVVTTTYANGDTKIVATDKNGYTTTTETSTTTETDEDGNTTVTVVTKTTDTNGAATTTTASTTTDKNGNVVEDIDTETSSEHGFSTAAHENHMMGGNSVGVAIASLNHAQDMLLQVDLDWLEQNRLTFSAGIQFANDELSDMKSSAEEQKLSGYYEAYGMFAQGAASGVGIATTLAATRSARNNINIQNKHIEREQSTLDLLNRSDKTKEDRITAGDDLGQTHQSDIHKATLEFAKPAVMRQPKEGEMTVAQDMKTEMDDSGKFQGENMYILSDDGKLQLHGTNNLAGIPQRETLSSGRSVRIDKARFESGDLENCYVDDNDFIVNADGNRLPGNPQTTGVALKTHINAQGEHVDPVSGNRISVNGNQVDAQGYVVSKDKRTNSYVRTNPERQEAILKSTIDANGMIVIPAEPSTGTLTPAQRARFVTKAEVLKGEPLRHGDGNPAGISPDGSVTINNAAGGVDRIRKPNPETDFDVAPEDVEFFSRTPNRIGEYVGAKDHNTIGRTGTVWDTPRATARGITRGCMKLNRWRTGGTPVTPNEVDAYVAPVQRTHRFDYQNKRLDEAFSHMDPVEKTNFRDATARRLKEAQDSRATSLHEFTNASTLYNAAFGALGSVLGGYMKILSSNHSYDAQCEAAFSKYEGTIANNFFGAASNWQSQASKAYDQSLSVLSSSLDSLRRAVSRG